MTKTIFTKSYNFARVAPSLKLQFESEAAIFNDEEYPGFTHESVLYKCVTRGFQNSDPIGL